MDLRRLRLLLLCFPAAANCEGAVSAGLGPETSFVKRRISSTRRRSRIVEGHIGSRSAVLAAEVCAHVVPRVLAGHQTTAERKQTHAPGVEPGSPMQEA